MSSYSLPRAIEPGDDCKEFNCGEPTLNNYLRRRALANQASGAAHCYVTCLSDRVVGYYALALASVFRGDAPGSIRRNTGPVILLARLAVDVGQQGKGLGKNLLKDAIIRAATAADIIGVRALAVHALSQDARQFYLHYDFEPSPTDPAHLFLLMKDINVAWRPLEKG